MRRTPGEAGASFWSASQASALRNHDRSGRGQLDRLVEREARPSLELLFEPAGLELQARRLLVDVDPRLALGRRGRPDRSKDGVGSPEQRRRPRPVATGRSNAGRGLEALGDRSGLVEAADDRKALLDQLLP